ncbi:MAG TPA: amidohydrolase family protein [Candidatus Aminicenantes bacterium]|nr:amidohydrolase family protein [Candidatus Aminicenantes bacterium]
MKKRITVLWAAAVLALLLVHPAGRGAADPPLAVRGGTIITVTGGVIENGVLLIRGGRIEAVGRDVAVPPGAEVIDAAGAVVTPGLIDAFTHLGMERPEAGGGDFDESARAVLPQLSVIDAIDWENEDLPAACSEGVTSALSAPGEGALLSGRSALIRLPGAASGGGETMRFPAAVHANLGEAAKLRFGSRNRYPSTRMGAMALLRQTFLEARQYLETKAGPDRTADAAVESLGPALKGEIPLVVRANRLDDILTAVRLGDEFGLRLVVNHGAAASQAASELAERKIPVLVGPLADFRRSPESAADSLENAVRLQRAGVKIAFQGNSGRRPDALLEIARLAVAHGLSEEEAWRALTLNPAEIFSVAGRIGSLEAGKDADVVIFSADPLRETAVVRTVISRGRIVFSR